MVINYCDRGTVEDTIKRYSGKGVPPDEVRFGRMIAPVESPDATNIFFFANRPCVHVLVSLRV